MNSGTPEHFPDHYIDEIRGDPQDNFFTPVLNEVLACTGPLRDVCDVGCGNGIFSIAIKQKAACRLVGVDGSRHALAQAKERGFDELHRIDDFSSDRLPFEDGSFDLVLNKDVLEHLLHPEHLVGEIARIVRDGRYALIHVPNHFTLVGRLRLLFRNTIDPFDYFPEAERWDFPHIRFFTMESLVRLCRLHGLDVVSDMGFHFFSPSRLGRLLPDSLKKGLCRRNPDAWIEGYTALFRKAGG